MVERRKLKEFLVIFFVYSFLALIATYPLVFSMKDAVIGGGDSVQNAWNLWWVQRAISHEKTTPFFTKLIYWPEGVSLAYHPLEPLNGLFAILLQVGLGSNLIKIYNVLALLTFVLTGVSTYYLAKLITGNPIASFVASIIFMFSPIRMSRVHFGNLEMYSTAFIPLAVLFVIKMLKANRYSYATMAAISFAATVWISLYLALGLGIILFILIVVELIRNKSTRLIQQVLYLVVIITILCIPVVLPMISDFSQFKNQANQIDAARGNNADLLGFFVPDKLMSTVRWGERIIPAYSKTVFDTYSTFYGNPSEKTVFIGFSVMILLLISGILVRNSTILIWWLIAFFFFVLSLGPTLFIGGEEITSHLPYEFLLKIPLISFGRAPSRLSIFLMLCLAIICGSGLAALEGKYPRLKLVVVFFAVMIFGEFLTIPVHLDSRFNNIPSFYYTFSEKGEVEGILDIPIDLFGAQGPGGNYMLYQTVHGFPIVGGYISRTPDQALWPFDYPYLNELRARIYGDTTPYDFDQIKLSNARSDLRVLNIDHVVLHRDELSENDFYFIRENLIRVLQTPYYEDDFLSVWEVPNQ